MPASSKHRDRSLFAGLAGAGLALLGAVVGSAQATWSILIADTRTGEIVVGSATCVENIDLRRETPVLITGVGAATAQSVVDIGGNNRRLIRDRLLQGVPVDEILAELAATDSGHDNRQYGFITPGGGRLTYSGSENAQWAGGMTGRIDMGRLGPSDDLVYAVQGNILSGENVVQAAVDAIVSSESDLPGRLMEAMAAARVAGGDGRCSCSPGDPTGCGSPPPGPFKSAHVGYMLGARAGDKDAARNSYPVSGRVGGVALPDLDADGMPDVVLGDAETAEIVIYRNAATPGDPLSHLLPWQTIAGAASGTVAIESGDFNNDGLDDFAVAHANPPRLSVYEGNGSGFKEPVLIDLPAAPTGIATGNMISPGDDIAVSLGSLGKVVFIGVGDGGYGQLGELPTDGEPTDLEINEFVGGAPADLAVTHPGSDQLQVFEHAGALVFGPPAVIFTADEPVQLDSTDMDLDGDNEIIVVSDAGRRAQVFSGNGAGWGLDAEVTLIRDGNAVAAGVFTPDTTPDIITIADFQNRNLQLFTRDDMGNYGLDDLVRVGSAARHLLLEDMNRDGTMDIVIANGGDDGVILIDNPRGHDLPQPDRFAAGDYFMEFNIPFADDGDPDPVDQMQAMFDDWRASLIGQVDGVQSSVNGLPRMQPGSGTTLSIRLRDWQGNAIEAEPGSWVIRGGEGLFELPAEPTGSGGSYMLTIDSLGPRGSDELDISASGAGHAGSVRLMPSVRVSVVEHLTDMNGDGICNFFDVSLFIDAYLTGDGAADLFADGMINFHDLSVFVLSFPACAEG